MLSEKLLTTVKKESEKNIALDFDSVIHSYTTPFSGRDYIPDPPVRGAIEGVKKLYESGYTIHICSARAATKSATKAIWEWLKRYEIDIYIENVSNIKPCCKLFLDDKCVTFNGNWGDALYDIEMFVPWQENPALK